jgi:hypothetical protein
MHWETLGRLAEMHHDEMLSEAAGARRGVSSGTPIISDLADLADNVRSAGVRIVAFARVAGGAVGRLRPHVKEAVSMARFMDVHSGFVGVTATQLREAHERDLAIEMDEGVHFERAWLDPATGKVFCLSNGPTKEAVMRVHERAGHATAEVYELAIEVA